MSQVVVTAPGTVVVRETQRQVVRVVARGPQGPVGTVNPEMYTLRDQAAANQAAAAASQAAALASEQAAAASEVAALASQNAAAASQSAALASQNAAAASESAAAGSAGTATTQAGIATTMASEAAASAIAAAADASYVAGIAATFTAYGSDPEMDGAASAGSSINYARGDHRHPTDTSRAATDGSNATGIWPVGITGSAPWSQLTGRPGLAVMQGPDMRGHRWTSDIDRIGDRRQSEMVRMVNGVGPDQGGNVIFPTRLVEMRRTTRCPVAFHMPEPWDGVARVAPGRLDFNPGTGGLVVGGQLSTGGSLSVTGDIVASGNVTGFSDARLKKDFERIEGALDKVRRLNGYTFSRIDLDDTRQMGLVAQEVALVAPEVVVRGDKYLSLAYGNLVALLVEAIKELESRLGTLENKV